MPSRVKDIAWKYIYGEVVLAGLAEVLYFELPVYAGERNVELLEEFEMNRSGFLH